MSLWKQTYRQEFQESPGNDSNLIKDIEEHGEKNSFSILINSWNGRQEKEKWWTHRIFELEQIVYILL